MFLSIWSETEEKAPPPPLHLRSLHPVDSSRRSTSGRHRQTWDVSHESSKTKKPSLTPAQIPALNDSVIFTVTFPCSWIFHLFQSQWPSSQRPPFFIFFFSKQDFSKSWMSHPSALSILSSQTVGRGWRSAHFSYRAHWSELVNRSPPAHWLCRRVEEVRLRRRRRSDQTVERRRSCRWHAPLHSPWLAGRVLHMYGNEL